jgi:DNA-binding protein HU-beta
MNRSQLLKSVSERSGAHKRDVEHVWENTLAVIQDAIKSGEKVALGGFGTFKQRVRKARDAVNPRTGEKIRVAAAKLPSFTPGKVFKQYVSGQIRALPKVETKPMALSEDGGAKRPAAKATAARKPAAKGRTTARRSAARKPARAGARRKR